MADFTTTILTKFEASTDGAEAGFSRLNNLLKDTTIVSDKAEKQLGGVDKQLSGLADQLERSTDGFDRLRSAIDAQGDRMRLFGKRGRAMADAIEDNIEDPFERARMSNALFTKELNRTPDAIDGLRTSMGRARAKVEIFQAKLGPLGPLLLGAATAAAAAAVAIGVKLYQALMAAIEATPQLKKRFDELNTLTEQAKITTGRWVAEVINAEGWLRTLSATMAGFSSQAANATKVNDGLIASLVKHSFIEQYRIHWDKIIDPGGLADAVDKAQEQIDRVARIAARSKVLTAGQKLAASRAEYAARLGGDFPEKRAGELGQADLDEALAGRRRFGGHGGAAGEGRLRAGPITAGGKFDVPTTPKPPRGGGGRKEVDPASRRELRKRLKKIDDDINKAWRIMWDRADAAEAKLAAAATMGAIRLEVQKDLERRATESTEATALALEERLTSIRIAGDQKLEAFRRNWTLDPQLQSLNNFTNALADLSAEAKDAGKSMLVDFGGDFAQAMGVAIASGASMSSALSEVFRSTVSNAAIQFGQLFVLKGAALMFEAPALGVGMIAGGLALQAFGAGLGAGGGKKGAGSGAPGVGAAMQPAFLPRGGDDERTTVINVTIAGDRIRDPIIDIVNEGIRTRRVRGGM